MFAVFETANCLKGIVRWVLDQPPLDSHWPNKNLALRLGDIQPQLNIFATRMRDAGPEQEQGQHCRGRAH